MRQYRRPFVLLETVQPDRENQNSYLFKDFKGTLVFRAGDDLGSFFKKAETFLKKGYWLAGYFTYEFGYCLEPALIRFAPKTKDVLAWLAVCRRPQTIDHRPQTGGRYEIKNIKQSVTRKQYAKDIRVIKKHLEQGDTYQVNYTFKTRFDFSGSPAGFYQALKSRQPTPYSALIFDGRCHILSFSPELFFRREGQKITARPMKGTLALNSDPLRFIGDPKTRAENIMIVDLLRNDLGRICQKGTVKATKLFALEKYPTLFQMTSTIQGRLKKSIGWQEIFTALFPCGSVTGAPKIETMKIIHGLEKEPRGVYCGAIGYIAPDQTACFNVAIRTAVIQPRCIAGMQPGCIPAMQRGELGIGGGIVYDSSPAREYQEALLKARFLTSPAPTFSLIETMLWQKAKGIYLEDLHFDRLARSLNYFSIALNIKALRKELRAKLKKLKQDSKIRVLVDQQGRFAIAIDLFDRRQSSFKIKISQKRLDHQDPFLYHKTTLRDLYESELKLARKQGFFEVIFLNTKDQVCEGSFTNIFIQKHSRLYTPPVSCGLLPGVLRQHLLKTGKAKENILYLKDLRQADKVFVGNSVRGLLEVEQR